MECKQKFNDTFDRNIESIKIRSKCKWYEEVEKNSKFFLNHEKNCATKSEVRLLEIKGKESKKHKKIMENFHRFYKGLFSIYVPVSNKYLCN